MNSRKLHADEQGELTVEEKSKLFVELMNKRKKHFARLRAEEQRRKPPTKAQKINTMSTYLKNMAGYKHKQLKTKKLEVSSKLLTKQLKRKIGTLWKLLKLDMGITMPERGYEECLKGDLKGRIVGIKRLHDDLGVNTAKVRVTAAKHNLRLRIEQYFQVQDYALWDVIENGNSFKPVAQTTTNADGTSTSLIPGPVTTEEKAQKKNDVKARSMLLMALPNEHLMTFNKYKDAKTLFAAIQTRFGGNEATKKTQKTLLKQMYENFSALSTESLDSIFNRLQKIISQLAILGENISQEDLNLNFLRSLPSEWNAHVLVWRNKPYLDTMSFDDLYNNFMIVEQVVKGTASSISTASTQVSTANLSDDTAYAFLASQPNGSQLVYEHLEQIHEDDIDEMDLKCQLALLSMRTRRGPRNQDNRNKNQDSSRRTVNVEKTSSKAMLAIDW
ncbi:hypothetical protein Tco_1022520 [Tanacetum coccineum]